MEVVEMISEGYSLIIIEDEQTALAGSIPAVLGSKSTMFLVTSLMILLVAAIIIGAARAISIQRAQSRLEELCELGGIEPGEYNSRSIRSIRNQILVLENDIAENSLGGVIPSFHAG
ncbi:MAG: hypothetical protein IJ058_07225 [Lachnospiraceae bacterium]|nr:hypothetical protein [Lachnospiraceae bacterium]